MCCRLQDMAVAPAFGAATTRGFLGRSVVAGELPEEQREKLAAAIRLRGADLWGRKWPPVHRRRSGWTPARTAPLRAARLCGFGRDGKFQVMPGGFCRISERLDLRAVAMGAGVQTSDVWIVATRRSRDRACCRGRNLAVRRIMGNLPSRAADNLFWLGRYLERAEATLRLIRCLASRVIENEDMSPEGAATTQRLRKLLTDWGAVPPSPRSSSPQGCSIPPCSMRTNLAPRSRWPATPAHRLGDPRAPVRGHLAHPRRSLQALEQAQPTARRAGNPGTAEIALQAIASISGLAQENMNRVAGWRFLEIGRRLERGVNTCRFMRHFGMEQARADGFRRAARPDRFPDHLPLALSRRRRAISGARHGPARSL